MPVMNPGGSGSSSGSGANPGGSGPQRATFRPPWVKDGPQPIPMPSAPWAPSRRSSTTTQDAAKVPEPAPGPVRKQSKITIIPTQPSQPGPGPRENGQNATRSITRGDTTDRNKAPPPPANEKRSQPPAPVQARNTPAPSQPPTPAPEPAVERKRPSLTHQKASVTSQQPPPEPPTAPAPPAAPAAPAPPPPPPAPPAPPPAPPGPPGEPLLKDRKPLSSQQKQTLDALRNRPRKRPDYSCLMKEIEGGRRLKRVQCNDRSRPLLPKTKAKGQFIYESEKSNLHNQLLKAIETGVRLKKVKTNDRSKPLLDGLRKFRRQMTIEEQMQKTEAPEEQAEEPDDLDDLDDIDRVRDDLQSTKQMLALELRNKEAMERENKRLLARLLNLEAELEAERARKSTATAPEQQPGGGGGSSPEADKLIAKLKEENENQQKVGKEMEGRYHAAAEELDVTKAQLEEALFQKKQAEKQLRDLENGLVEGGRALQKQLSKKLISSKSGDLRKQMSQAKLNDQRKPSMPAAEEDSESEYTDETVTESEDETEEENLSNDPEAQERRVQRELKLLATKLKAFKDKEASARKERTALREQFKIQQKALKEERAKYKSLQKEVDKMAKLMKEDDEEGDEEPEEEEEESESEESESEESEGDEEDDEGSGEDLPADAPTEEKRKNITNRTRRHEGILSALKKGNYLLKANIDRLKDDLVKHREMSLMLQEDLNSVLAELG